MQFENGNSTVLTAACQGSDQTVVSSKNKQTTVCEMPSPTLPHSAQTWTLGPCVCKCFLIAELSRNILVQPCSQKGVEWIGNHGVQIKVGNSQLHAYESKNMQHYLVRAGNRPCAFFIFHLFRPHPLFNKNKNKLQQMSSENERWIARQRSHIT